MSQDSPFASFVPPTGVAWNTAPHADRYPESTSDPLAALVTELRETNRLLAALIARQSAPSAESAKPVAKPYTTL
jgi:hypothetical protein